LGIGGFDAIVSSMALMDIPVVAPIYQAASQLLRPQGRFVFATMHPAFNSNNPVFFHEKEDRDGDVCDFFGVKIRAYLDVPPVKGAGAPDEPTPHYYYHRTFSDLLGPAFAAGFALDALLEPAFAADDPEISDRLSWYNLWQIPPVLSGRLRMG
jgi:SAM-dependent methyltransferase